jgi:hypothetical protein
MTTMTTVPTPVHHVVVVSGGDEYRSECSCGWVSGWQFTPEDADDEGTWHRDDAARAEDAMDSLMSDLLDLQDDLAAVVVWLAENWATGLPCLEWDACGGGQDRDRPIVRVLGYASPAALTAAALVLDATPTDDPPDEAGQARYRRVRRDFGRARVEVLTEVAS